MSEFKRIYNKYIVFKIADVQKYLSPEEKRQLVIISETILNGRHMDDKKDNHYVVVNEDEPYSEQVWKLIEDSQK
jgi:predicted DNA-binding protein (MmcQ/YjbR family)